MVIPRTCHSFQCSVSWGYEAVALGAGDEAVHRVTLQGLGSVDDRAHRRGVDRLGIV